MKRLFTSESVTSGHPDKMCDLIADSIVDEALKQDSESHMAVEATIKDDFVLIYGEAKTKAKLDYVKIAKDVIKEIGYNEDFKVEVLVNKQSEEIDNAVVSKELAAGDQGIMFGYACDETNSCMPLSIDMAHMLAKTLDEVRRQHKDILKPDGKTQVTVEYDGDTVKRIDTILVSASHHENVTKEKLEKIIKEEVIDKVVPSKYIDEQTKIIINPSGSFTICGPFGDSGTTGRKIIVDSYGGVARVGGGCFSSKDPSKVDRSAAYYARYVCKSLVKAKLCKRCELQLAYAIGKPKPVSVAIDTYGTGIYDDGKILEIINKNFDFSVSNMINELNLKAPIYKQTVNYGHFGKPYLPWEKEKEIIK